MPKSVTDKTIKLPPDPCVSSCTKKSEIVGKASDLAEQLKSATVNQKIDWGSGFKPSKSKDTVAFNPQPDPPGDCGGSCEGSLQLKSISSSNGPALNLNELLDPASTQALNKLIAGTGG